MTKSARGRELLYAVVDQVKAWGGSLKKLKERLSGGNRRNKGQAKRHNEGNERDESKICKGLCIIYRGSIFFFFFALDVIGRVLVS